MNYKIFLSYLLILGFFLCLVFAYMKYNDSISEAENDKLRQQIIAVLDKEVSNLQSQIDALKNSATSNNKNLDDAIINNFIKSNPGLIATTLEEFFHKKNISDQSKAIADGMSLLLTDFNQGMIKTFIGKANAPIKVVEFYDYSCKFCAQMGEINKKIIEQNQDVMVIFIEVPMLGPDSIEATKFAIAVSMFDSTKYEQLQVALFNSRLPKNKDNLMQIATSVGIDSSKLQTFIEQNLDKIEERVKQNSILFNNMKIQGTPTYIIGSTVLVGAVEFDQMNDVLVKERNRLKK